MPKCNRYTIEMFQGVEHRIECPICSDLAQKYSDHPVKFLPEGDQLACGCLVKDIHPPDPFYPDWEICVSKQCEKHAPKVDSRKATPGTEFAFTLTMPPDYKPNKTVIESAKLIMKNGLTADKPYEKASQWAIVLEHTDKGTPHVHGVYKTESGRRISAKYFKRYWDLWDEKVKLGAGHKGGYHAKARHSESYAAYLEKEGVVINGLNNQTGELNSPE